MVARGGRLGQGKTEATWDDVPKVELGGVMLVGLGQVGRVWRLPSLLVARDSPIALVSLISPVWRPKLDQHA